MVERSSRFSSRSSSSSTRMGLLTGLGPSVTSAFALRLLGPVLRRRDVFPCPPRFPRPPQSARQFRQPGKGGHAAQPQLVVYGRVAADYLPGGDVVGNAAL